MVFSSSDMLLPEPVPFAFGRDPLTGLDRIEALMARISEEASPLALVLFDIDALKAVNACHGYATGDAILKTLADRLLRTVQSRTATARLEGARFAVLLRNTADADAAIRYAERTLALLHLPHFGQGPPIAISIRAGVALRQARDQSPRDLIASVDAALAAAKAKGKLASLFEPGTRTAPRQADLVSEELNRAWRLGEWRLHYQPQIREPGRVIDGVEALLRWEHPERGLLTPAAFLEDLEAHPTAAEIGRWVIARACRDLAAWRAGGLRVPRVAVNLFAGAPHRRTFRTDVVRAIAENGLAFDDLELEVTEGTVVDPESELLRELHSLRELGVHIALDDFGTGFACLATLRHLPIDCLKIDRSFVAGMRESSTNRAVVRAVISIGRELGFRVVAEGVETDRQVVGLMRMGCRLFQGFRYSRALSADGLKAWADAGRPPARRGGMEAPTSS